MSKSQSDPIPEGYLTLTEARQHLSREMPGVHGGHLDDVLLAAFGERELEAFVRLPASSENMRLLQASWKEHPFPERLFMSPDVPEHFASTSWGAFVGRTPFVPERDFELWLEGLAAKRDEALVRQFDPAAESSWTLAMATAWIGEHTFDAVREYWPRFRAARYGLRDGAQLLWSQEGSLARTEALIAKAAAGAVRIVGIDQKTDSPREIPRDEFHYINLVFDPDLSARFVGPAASYRDIRVELADVLAVWKGANAELGTTRSAPEKAAPPPSDAALKKCVSKARARLRELQLPDLTRAETEALVGALYKSSKKSQRRTVAESVPATPKRRAPAVLANRTNELEDLRQFLAATI